jgi:hypothetical protein
VSVDPHPSERPRDAGNAADAGTLRLHTRASSFRWDGLPALAALAGFELWLVLAYALSPHVPLDPRAGYAIGFLSVSASAVVTACASPPLRPRALVALALPCALLWAVASQQGAGLVAAAAVTAALLIAGVLVGGVVGGLIEHPGQLLFVAIVAGAADVASVVHPSGPSAALANTPAALALFMLPWPMLGTRDLVPLLGVGDIVFAALYVASSRHHGLSVRRTAIAELAAFVATMLLVLVLERAIPALPLLGCAVVLAQPLARKPSERDRTRGYVIAVFALIAVTALLLR